MLSVKDSCLLKLPSHFFDSIAFLFSQMQDYAPYHSCQPIFASLSNTGCLVSRIMKLLNKSMRNGQVAEDRDRQGNQLSAARYFCSSH